MRVLSLIASSTEIVAALGYEHLLVGRSHECDSPTTVRALPQVTSPKFNVEGTSYEIDQKLKAILQEGLSVYRVDAAAVDRLRPDLIITQTQCEVCAVSLRDVENAVCELITSRPKIVSLHPNVLEDILRDIRVVADALGDRAAGEKLVAALKERVSAIEARAAGLKKPRVAYIEWIEPIMTGGNWMPELVRLAGGEDLFGRIGTHSPYLEWETLVNADPDVIVVCPCGFDLKRTESEMRFLTDRPEWKNLRAVREGRVALADGNQFFNRPGPRIVESLETLAEILHPTEFSFGHLNASFKPF